jgi:hypothetical protein
MKSHTLIVALVALPTVASAQTVPVATPLAPAVLAKGLADSKPWNWTVPDGKAGKMTFMPGGKAVLYGPITMNIGWAVKGQEFCIAMGMMLGTKCLTATAVKGGYQTFQKGKPAFLFTR